MKIMRPIDWQEVASQELSGAAPEVDRDGRALTHSVIRTKLYHRSMNSERMAQHTTQIHSSNPFIREETIEH
jgi:hypothetical protein